ncbi:hypothetical protein Tsubulata_048390 [Turnera subulata]|uniref:RING-type domain-containing protein n=1 Tax=Turnera subulata TaxID=218843 RepID=A0A9Q0G2Q5_9ROSI|nr:hypothetical protein Tsubulata_048390 [Turnera subulata]
MERPRRRRRAPATNAPRRPRRPPAARSNGGSDPLPPSGDDPRYDADGFFAGTPRPAPRTAVENLPLVEAKTEQECAICSDNIVKGEKNISLPCNHSFHTHCILAWFEGRDTCPLCRSILC